MVNGKLSVVVPGFNEESIIYSNLLEIEREIGKIAEDFEILFVDDGSTDNTVTEAKRAADENRHIKVLGYRDNAGKGFALKTGVAEATGDYIAFVDADLDLHPSQLSRFFIVMQDEQADAVIGSKQHPESELDYPKSRRFVSKCYAGILFLLFRLKVKDTQTGMKLFVADKLKPIMSTILVKRFAFDIEVLALFHYAGYKIAEAPIKLEFRREESWGRIKFKDMFGAMWDTLAVFYRMYIRKYYSKGMKK